MRGYAGSFLTASILVLMAAIVFMPILGGCKGKNPPPPGTTTETGGKSVPPTVGNAAPLFETQDYSGKKFSLKDFRGKVVFLDFFATWCPPCRLEIPYLQQFHQTYKSQDLVVIGIAMQPGDTVLPFMKTMNADYLVVQGSRELFEQYRASSIPAGFLLDREGKIVYQAVGFGPADAIKIETAIKQALETKPL